MNQTKLRDGLIMGGLMAVTVGMLVFNREAKPFFIKICIVMSLFFYAYIVADPRLYKSRTFLHQQYAYWLTVLSVVLILFTAGLMIKVIETNVTIEQTRLYNMTLTIIIVLMSLCLFIQYALDAILNKIAIKEEKVFKLNPKSFCVKWAEAHLFPRKYYGTYTIRPYYNEKEPVEDCIQVNLVSSFHFKKYDGMKKEEETKVPFYARLKIPLLKLRIQTQAA